MLSESLGILCSLWGWLASVEREISAELALMLRAFAETRDWSALAGCVPFGIAFGAAHALTPGHSRTVLSLFAAGSGASLSRDIGTAVILSASRIAIGSSWSFSPCPWFRWPLAKSGGRGSWKVGVEA